MRPRNLFPFVVIASFALRRWVSGGVQSARSKPTKIREGEYNNVKWRVMKESYENKYYSEFFINESWKTLAEFRTFSTANIAEANAMAEIDALAKLP